MSRAHDSLHREGAALRRDDAFPSRFRVRGKLGRGGTGNVVRAYDCEMGIDVALKTIRRAEGDALLRFKREFRAVRDVRHPNLVELFELIEHDGEWLYTMEIVEGLDPLEYVRTDRSLDAGSFDERKLRRLLVQLASGLESLHRAGMVHRDVKPSNVLVTPEGRVVLLDFGLVASAHEGLQSTDVPTAGTVCYMAPEQGLGLPVAPASDWYAFGVLLFEALTGRAPYEGMTLEILLAKAQRPAREPRELVPSVPEDLSRLCARLMAVDPADRPSGSEVLACLGVAAPKYRGNRRRVLERADLVGRTDELDELRAAAERAFTGELVAVHVEGAPGVGKTALLTAFIDSLRDSHPALVVLRGHCDRRERVPYQGLDGIIDGLSSYLRKRFTTDPPLASALLRLSRVFPVLRRVPSVRAAHVNGSEPPEGDDEVAELASALRPLLANVASSSPTLLSIENVQWLDEASRALLAELVRPPNAPPVLVVTTARREEGERDEGERALELEPLAPAEAEALALRRIAQVGSRVDARAIAREAEGIPIFIEELVELAKREELAAATFDDLLAARVGALGEGARRLLELCTASGRSTHRSVLVAASGATADDAHRDLRALVAARLLRETRGGNGLAAYHPRIAASVEQRLDPALARALNRQLTEADAATRRPSPDGDQ